MIGKVKQWLGIEGVKLELLIPEGQTLATGSISGTMRFQSMNPQTVTGIRVVLIERYSRGRKEELRIDEYELGRLEIQDTFDVIPDHPIERQFTLKFEALESDVDRWGNRNPLNRQIARAARWLRKAESQYRVEAEAKVKGVALNPFDKKTVELS